MTDDEWQAHVTRESAKEIGEWLSARGTGKLRSPIASLTLPELEAMASHVTISNTKLWNLVTGAFFRLGIRLSLLQPHLFQRRDKHYRTGCIPSHALRHSARH